MIRWFFVAHKGSKKRYLRYDSRTRREDYFSYDLEAQPCVFSNLLNISEQDYTGVLASLVENGAYVELLAPPDVSMWEDA